MKKIALIAVLVLSMAFMAFALAGAGEEEQPRIETIDAFGTLQRPASLFNHDQHMELAEDNCTVCHHVYKDGKLVEGESSEDVPCSECHKLQPTKDNSMPLQKAYHKNCISCHEAKGKGPVMCGQCHTK
ncbi:MAG: acidic tetraheme cytochrome c3 TmcA [Desulfovibrio sp.]|uniref:acidic tetraheme cytochrome c3 TmcA n=1 Tax=Desulfovibrio sp. 7SRBS1 TaxID=3378064 RepID=UPI003B3F3F28